MATQTTQTQITNQPRRTNRPRNRNQKKTGTGNGNTTSGTVVPEEQPKVANAKQTGKAIAVAEEEEDDSDVCWICAESIKYYSLSECNRRTCHICALRLRALYKKKECTFCNLKVFLKAH